MGEIKLQISNKASLAELLRNMAVKDGIHGKTFGALNTTVFVPFGGSSAGIDSVIRRLGVSCWTIESNVWTRH